MAGIKISLLLALALTGMLCGASLDQSIKQLPARHFIGVKAFSEYAKSADLKNGVVWYAILGLGSVIFTVVTAIIANLDSYPSNVAVPLYAAVTFAIGQFLCTTQAASTYFKQLHVSNEHGLKMLLDRFETIQAFRSAFILIQFVLLVITLYLLLPA